MLFLCYLGAQLATLFSEALKNTRNDDGSKNETGSGVVDDFSVTAVGAIARDKFQFQFHSNLCIQNSCRDSTVHLALPKSMNKARVGIQN